MPFVVDASVVGAWVLPDEQQPEAIKALERLKDDDGIIPGLLWFEVRNLLLMNERRQRITPAQTASALSHLAALPLEVDDRPDSDTVLQVAREHQLSAYDAAYLELSLRRNLPLLTFDRKLQAAAVHLLPSRP